jgi:PAS domain S-box-containing protein
MKKKISFEEIEKDLAELNKTLKTIKKKAPVEKALNNIIENVKFQARELHRREQLFKIMSSPASIMDADGRRIDANDACCEYFKRAREEYIGAKLEEMYAKEDAPKIKKCLAECKETGFGTCEVIVIKGDGTRTPAIINLNTVRDEFGNIINIIGTAQDITELKEKEQEMDFIFENSRAAMVLTDEEGRWIRFNRAAERDFGFKREEVLGKKTPEQKCLTPETIPSLKNLWKYVIEQKTATEEGVDVPWIKKDGSIVIHNAYEAPYGEKGEGRLYTAIDVTEVRKREREQANAILSLSKALSKTATGDLSARVDTKGWNEELEVIGMTVNTLIESLEVEKKEKG